jgi:arylsulfatase A
MQDPGQKTDVAEKYPDVLKELSDAYKKKCVEVTKDGFDPLPAHLGHPDWPTVVLPGHEAFLVTVDGAGISYHQKNGWANDWITNWTNTAAYARWPLEIIRPLTCEVTLLYTCSKENLGAKATVQIQDKTLEAVITEAHDPPPLPSPTRGGTRYEVPEKIWRPLTLGTVKLQKGSAKVTVRAVDIPGKQMFDLKAVKIRTLD